jgi:hypothetical protein
MSGKAIILIMALVSAACGYGFYVYLGQANSQKEVVISGMEYEFLEFQEVQKQVSDLEIAELNDVLYSISYRDPWKFEIHDKTLIVLPPPMRPEPKAELTTEAKSKVQEAIYSWLEDKFGSRDKIAVEVSM